MSLLEGGKYVTGFEYINEKHINLRQGTKDVLVINTVCKSGAVNLRVAPQKAFDPKFLTGQIQAGNAEAQERFPVEESWKSLGARNKPGNKPKRPASSTWGRSRARTRSPSSLIASSTCVGEESPSRLQLQSCAQSFEFCLVLVLALSVQSEFRSVPKWKLPWAVLLGQGAGLRPSRGVDVIARIYHGLEERLQFPFLEVVLLQMLRCYVQAPTDHGSRFE